MSKTKKILLFLAGAFLFWFAYFTISPLFIVLKMEEPVPTPLVARPASSLPDEPKTIASGEVVGTPLHPSSGRILIIEAGDKKFVRYENYKTVNGPDIFVYLGNDLDAEDYVSLGKVKATEGSANYEIPEGVDPAGYRYVLTWCRAFGVLFNSAEMKAL